MLALRTLGSTNLLDSAGNGLTPVLSQPKRYALLVYLAVSRPGELHRRDALLPLFWPEFDESRARGALSQALFYLRRHLPEGVLVKRGTEEVGLDSASVRVDVLIFQEAVASGSWGRAMDLYRGDFLPGFHVKGAPLFDDWMSGERDRLRTVVTNAAWTLAQDQVRWGALAEGERTAAWATDRVCPDETTARRFMEALASAGDRVAAIRYFRRYEATLATALDLSPSPAMVHLARTLRSEEGRDYQAPLAKRPEGYAAIPAQPTPVEVPPDFLASATEPGGESFRGRQSIRFAGREEELSRLHQFLDHALKGQGLAVFISGEAGTGKSVLAREFCTRSLATYPDLVVATGYCDAHMGLGDAYRPFREILRLLTGDVERAWRAGSMSTEQARRLWTFLPEATDAILAAGPELLNTLIPVTALANRLSIHESRQAGLAARVQALDGAEPSLAGSFAQSKLFDQIGRVLERIARVRPLLLILEGLQWADAGSLELLLQLGRHLEGSRVLVLGLYRPSEISVGRNDERHPLLKAVTELRMIRGRREVALTENGDRPFFEAVIDSEPNSLGPEFRDALFGLTRGHALFTVELLKQFVDGQQIRRDGEGRWVATAQVHWESVPDRVEAVLEERIGRLPEALHRILSVASVEGEHFTLEVVAAVMEEDPAELLPLFGDELEKRHRLVELVEVGRLQEHRLTRFRFRHILFQQFLYNELNGADRALLHEEVGWAVEGLYGEESEEKALELARHFQEAGLPQRAVAHLVRASERARRASAFRESVDLLRRAWTLIRTQPESMDRDVQELEVLSRVSKMVWITGLFDPESQVHLDRFRTLAERLGDHDARFWIRACDASRHHLLDEQEKGRKDIEELAAIADLSGNPSQRVVVHTLRALNVMNLGRPRATINELAAYERLYDPARDDAFLSQWLPETKPVTRAMKALVLGPMGYPEAAEEQMREAHALVTPDTDWPARLTVRCWDLCLRVLFWDPESAKTTAGPLEQVAREFGQSGYLAMCDLARGWYAAERGDLEAGCRLMLAALDTVDGLGWGIWRPVFVGLIAPPLAEMGRAEEALRATEGALKWVREKGGRWQEPELQRARGEVLLLLPRPDPVSAEAAFHRAIAVAREQETKLLELRSTLRLASLLRNQGRTMEARATLASCYQWFTEGFGLPDLEEAKALLKELA